MCFLGGSIREYIHTHPHVYLALMGSDSYGNGADEVKGFASGVIDYGEMGDGAAGVGTLQSTGRSNLIDLDGCYDGDDAGAKRKTNGWIFSLFAF